MNPELIQTMRAALEAVMARVPADQSVFGLKAAMAEVILKAAAHGHTSFDGLVASASGQIQSVISMLSGARSALGFSRWLVGRRRLTLRRSVPCGHRPLLGAVTFVSTVRAAVDDAVGAGFLSISVRPADGEAKTQ